MSKPTITVYERTSSYCVQCLATKRALTRRGIEFETVAIEDMPDAWLEGHKAEGRKQAPIVVVEHDNGGKIEWAGNRVDLIDTLEVR